MICKPVVNYCYSISNLCDLKMKMFLKLVSRLCPFIFIISITNAQSLGSLTLPEGLGLSNQLEYSYDIEDELEIFENWLNLDYRRGIFSAGFRFEVFQPNDPNPSINRGKIKYADIAYKYITAEIGNPREGASITVGNFYALFGRGMILKSYEDRNIRVDNNLLGVKVVGRYADFKLEALTGMPENAAAERNDILHAVDLEYKGLRNLRFGGSFASNDPGDNNTEKTMLASARVQPSLWNFDGYFEYGLKKNERVRETIFDNNRDITGRGFYGNLNFFLGSLGVTSEYKYYDNFGFETNDRTVSYNTPPSVRKDYTYTLLNRHPSALDPNNEKGFQVELNYSLDIATDFVAAYSQTKTLDQSSFYQKVIGSSLPIRSQLEEFYFRASHDWSDNFKTIAAFGYNKELSSNTENVTPIIELKYYLDDINTFRLVLEHQSTSNNTTDEKYYDDVVLLEFLRSPKLTLTFVSEMQTREPDAGRVIRKFWNFFQIGYLFGEHTDVSLLFGSRQAGNICIGGVCRYEPEFRGVELKMQTRLY